VARLENQPETLQAGPGKTLKRLLSISHLAIDYPWPTIAFWAALSVAGVFAFLNLKLALFPDITFPVVVVTANTRQIDVTKNEQTVTNVLEGRLKGLSGVTLIHSLTYPEFAVVDMSFDVSTSLTARKSQVAAALDGIALPAGTKLSLATEDLNETPVVTYALVRKNLSLAQLGTIAERELAPKLGALDGVLKAEVLGAQATGPDASAYRYDGQAAVAVAVVKRAQANTLDVADACEAAVAAFRVAHPNLSVERTSEQATYIREATQATQEALGLAVVLAILVILPFLRDWRATTISAIAIPVSLLGTACVMRLLHFNLETITLLALALVVGVIVDDAIVAVENIVRHLEAGESPMQAALTANKEIGLTLVAASLTIVAVFLPIGLMQGTLGQFFRAFGITASAAVLFSLFAARTLSPTIAAWWLRSRTNGTGRAADVVRSTGHARYRSIVRWALAHRRYVMILAILAFAAGLGLIPFIPKGFLPHLDRGEFLINFQTPLGTTLDDTITVATKLEQSVRQDPAVSDIYTSVGAKSNQQNVGVLDVRLKADRKVKTIDVEDAVRGRLPALDGVVATVEDVPFVGTDTSKPLQFALVGSDLDALRTIGRQFERSVAKLKGFLDVSASGLSDGTPFSAIEHVNGKRAVQITADLSPSLQLGDANEKILALARKYLPKNKSIKLVFGGSSEDVVTTFRDFGFALGASVIAIYLVLWVLFRSWVDPIVIVISLPLSIVGALFALWVTRADFGLISLMAVIFLFGLVNKNAILLVDRINKLRSLGLSRSDALEEAGAQRLRPIVMTTAATILGMVPIALGFGAGAELRQPMAVAIIGGLVTSTALSLIVIPVAYTIFDDWTRGDRRAGPAGGT
jgi:multidrug efflux pump subunit AcrB